MLVEGGEPPIMFPRTTSLAAAVEVGSVSASKGSTARQSVTRQMTSRASAMRTIGFMCELIACVSGFTGIPITEAQPRFAPLRRHVVDEGSHDSEELLGGMIAAVGRAIATRSA